MKVGLKLLTLAMLFAMPLAGCGDNPKDDGKKDDEQQEREDEEEEEEEEEGGGGGQSGDIVHKGTQSDPYSINDAYLVWSELDSREATGAVYVKGKVTGTVQQNKDNQRVRLYLEDDTSDEELYVVDAYGAGKSSLSASSIKAGDELVVTGSLKKFNTSDGDLFEVCYDTTKKADCQVLTINGKATGNGGSGGGGGGSEGGEGGGGTVDPVTGDVVIDFSKTSSISGSVSGVTYNAEKSSAQNDPVVNSTSHDLRIYAKGKLTVSASSNMTQIDFAISAQGKKRQAEISCSTGKMSYDMNNSRVSWTGNASSVVFTVGDTATHGSESSKAGQFCFTSMAIAFGEGGSGSGEGGGGGSGNVDDEGEKFFIDVITAIDGETPVFGEDYFDDDGLWTYYDADDLKDDVDYYYNLLKDDFDCEAPKEDEYGYYGFYIYSEDGEYIIDVYSDEDDEGIFVEFDLYSVDDILDMNDID